MQFLPQRQALKGSVRVCRAAVTATGPVALQFVHWLIPIFGFAMGGFALMANIVTAGEPVPNVTVAADGTGNFRTVQQAINAAPEGGAGRFVIQVKPGRYHEKLLVPKTKRPIHFRGSDAATTILTFGDSTDTPDAEGKPIGTVRSASIEIPADDFAAENITFENTFGPGHQAVAVNVFGNRDVFRKCRFLGWQDTLLLKAGAQYFEDCYIAGTVDFIFGSAAAFFERCELHCLAPGAVTAASTPETQAHGFVFSHCRITAETASWQTSLGRPWRPFASVVFLMTEMPSAIAADGWLDWNGDREREKTVRYAEYRSSGPGANAALRVAWSKQLGDAEAAELTPVKVLGWNPNTSVPVGRMAALPPNRPGF